ncbi:MMPL family transporter [Dietzia sp. ANT_WB102]|uniref:MMPL family transporter n=1 Tax=Dietzia sp. ANT_WB102 TaxID=2597345 RepID=UPI0011EC7088|nr:MMPL family transporter [Dietzia sp. ANT_WB102]KAA0918650.1 MMPL family transporter [Dietzia sp. ANT_WB102]
MFNSLGRFVAHRRALVLVCSVLVMAFISLAGTAFGNPFGQGGFEDPASGWATAEQLEQEAYGRDALGDVVVSYHAPEGTSVDDPAFQEPIRASLESIRTEFPDQVTGVTSFVFNQSPALVNRDEGVAVASIQIAGEEEEILENFRVIEDRIAIDGIQTDVAGVQAVAGALQDGMDADLVRAELIALPLVFVLLIVVFGGVVAAFLPVAVGVLTILGSLGALHLLSLITPVNSFAQNVVTLIGLGLAIDYGLFVVSRFREEMAEGYPPDAAVRRAVATAGRTVVFSAVMVGVTLSGLLIFPQDFLKSVAYGAIAAVVLAAILSVTLLPAVLVLLGHRVDMLGIARLQRHRSREEVENGLFGRVADFSMKRPVAVAIPVVVVLVALIIPFSGVKFGGINETYLPPDNATRVAQEQYDENFPGTRTDPVKLVVIGSDGATLSQIRSTANEAPGLTGPFQFSRSGKQDAQGRDVVVLQTGVVDRNASSDTVEYLQSFPIPAGTEVYVGGNPAMERDSVAALVDGLPWFVLYVLLATTILMFLAFGSLVLPLKAAIMNLLGLGATLGILTWIFVDGHLSGLLGFTPGPLTSPVVVLLMAIIYGLSTDYEVFLVSRMVEARSRGARTAEAVRSGVANTGRIITSAALILIVVTGAFAFSEIVMMKYIAFGMIAALIIDATVIRMLLVPAVMQMLGTDNWWAPGWMKRIQERIGLGEAEIDDEVELLTGRPAAAVGLLEGESDLDPELEPESDPELEPESEFEPVYDTEYDEDPDPAAEGKIPAAELIARLMRERQQGHDA